jgi:uncharacterized protein (DUF2252 family)
MQIGKSTRLYEEWLASQTPLLPEDVKRKHAAMATAAFPFLRATFYRWAQLWPQICPELAAAPALLAVGDLHVENFGTWRDADGRLVWGINDFDEASLLPYTIDLVRLAASALLAGKEGHLALGGAEACAAILEGYAAGLAGGGRPYVLEENHLALRAMALGAEREPERFWARLATLKPSRQVPPRIRAMLAEALPKPAQPRRIVHRIAGLGSLGRQRFTVLAEWDGAWVARETKPLVPSAALWAAGRRGSAIRYATLLARAARCPDPSLQVVERWVVRRLAPRSSRIELAQLPRRRDERLLLEAMGRETANIHRASPAALAAISRDLKTRKKSWLRQAAAAMAEATLQDWKAWRG